MNLKKSFIIVVFAGLCLPSVLATHHAHSEEQAITIPKTKEVTVFNQETHAARGEGIDSARVDSQVTLSIPFEQAEEVYQYLRDKYVARDGILKEEFPSLHISGQEMSDVSIFTDEYFDTPELTLYKNKNSVRYRTRLNTTNPNDRKSGRELVQMKITPPGHFNFRTELKYKVNPPDYTNETHPLLRLLTKDDRDDCIKAFAETGIDARTLMHIFTIKQKRSRVYINLEKENIMSFSVDQGSTTLLGGEGKFASVDAGLVEITFTEASKEKRELMWKIRETMLKDLVEHFPRLTLNEDSKYSIILDQLLEYPLVRLVLRDSEYGYNILLAVLGAFVLIIALIDRYKLSFAK